MRVSNSIFVVVAFLSLAFSCWVSFYFATNPLLEHEAWRETQTAITSYWMIREGWSLAYQTPVLGYPWTIPLEFPVYQSIAAFISWATGWPLDPVGRLLSYFFLLACLFPIYQVFRKLEVPVIAFWILTALLFSSPVYLFFGRNFLMETTALFFTLTAIRYALEFNVDRLNTRFILMFIAFASLGMLQKVTTALPVLLILLIILITNHFLKNGLSLKRFYRLAFICSAFLIPILLTYAWFEYTDIYRNQNPFMTTHSSNDMVNNWFGTIDERMNKEALWSLLWSRVIVQNAGGLIGFSVVCLSLIFSNNRIRLIISACLIVGITVIFMFFRHHHFLDYYQVAAVVYFTAGLAISLAVLALKGNICAWFVSVLTSLIVLSNLYHFNIVYWPKINKQINPQNEFVLAVSKVIKETTPPDSVIIALGLMSRASLVPISAWTSELAYYSERKSLTVDDGNLDILKSNPMGFVGDSKIGAIVFCGDERHTKYADFIDLYKERINHTSLEIMNCSLLIPENLYQN